MEELKNNIKNWAAQELFDQVGFAPIEELPSEIQEYIQDWVNSGYAGEMAWFRGTIDERLNVRNYFPGVKTAIVFLHSYFHGLSAGNSDQSLKIAAYAHGKDYHKLLRKKLLRIGRNIKEKFPEAEFKISVDSSPLLERYWTYKAGLGWIGKNSMLISPECGSYTFISVLLTTLEISDKKPTVADHCGSCSKCMDACPTNAILANKKIDSSRCISYLTIEHKKEINDSLKDKIAPWVFGCDICLDVCPWNAKAIETRESRFFPVYDLKKIKGLINGFSETKFNEYFSGTPVRRAGANYFKYITDIVLKP